jgi:hypothetical protein
MKTTILALVNELAGKRVDLLKNIKIVIYKSWIVTDSGKDRLVEGVYAINTDMDAYWQVECYILATYKAKAINKTEIKDATSEELRVFLTKR